MICEGLTPSLRVKFADEQLGVCKPFPLQSNHSQLVGGLDRSAEAQCLIELGGEGYCGVIRDRSAHAYRAVDLFADQLGLGLAVAGVEDDDAHVVLQDAEQVA